MCRNWNVLKNIYDVYMKIRPATKDDIPGMMIVNKAVMPESEHYIIPTFELHIDLYKLTYVLWDKSVVGYIMVQINDGIEAHVTSIAVLPEYRGNRYGQRLLLTALLEVKKRKLQYTSLHVKTSNAVAIHIYEKLGFDKVRCKSKYYGDEDAFFMRRKG